MPDKNEEPEGLPPQPRKPAPDETWHVIRVANFDNPRPFESRPGAFHPYTYIPFLGWLPPVELNLLIAALAIILAIALPHLARARKHAAERAAAAARTNPAPAAP